MEPKARDLAAGSVAQDHRAAPAVDGPAHHAMVPRPEFPGIRQGPPQYQVDEPDGVRQRWPYSPLRGRRAFRLFALAASTSHATMATAMRPPNAAPHSQARPCEMNQCPMNKRKE